MVPLQRWPGLVDKLLAALDDPADDNDDLADINSADASQDGAPGAGTPDS